MLQCCVCHFCLSVRNVIVAKRCVHRAKVTIDSHEKSIGTKMNDIDLYLEVSRSCTLRYIRRWISRKPLEIDTGFQRTTNRKWHMGYQINGHVTDDITWPQRCCEAVRSAILATAWLLVLVCTCKPWLAAISHPKPPIVLSHGLSRLASRKDCKPAV